MPSLKNKPVTLLPLRMEIYHHTRREPVTPKPINPGTIIKKPVYVKKNEVWVRCYPDECQIFPHVSPITEKEEKAFDEYCKEAGCAGGETELRMVWLDFVREVGLYRARYIAGLSGKYLEAGKDDALRQFIEKGAELKALPERIRLYTYHEKNLLPHNRLRFLAEGSSIPSDLVISAGDHTSARWVTDFEEAVRVGMGIKLTLPAECNQVNSADWLIAVGCKDDSEGILEELLLRYKSLGELEVLQQDEPTNNTKEQKTGFAADEAGTGSEARMPNDRCPGLWNVPGGQMLADALGVAPIVFEGVRNAELEEQAYAIAMGNLLWDACTDFYCHYYMKYSTLDGRIFFQMPQSPDAWKLTTDFFKKYVIGRGMLPPVRIGDNPYGILPATSLEDWESSALSGLQGTTRGSGQYKYDFETAVAKLLKIFKKKFMNLSKTSPYIDIATPGDKFRNLIEILQHGAVAKRIDVQDIPREKQAEPVNRGFDAELQLLACELVANDGKWEYIGELAAILDKMALYDYTNTYDNPDTDLFDRQPADDIPILQRMLYITAKNLETRLIIAYHAAKPDDVQDAVKEIKAMSWQLERLKQAEVAKLETLLKEILDCLSYRLDAWMSALANLRLFDVSIAPDSIGITPAKVPPRNRLVSSFIYNQTTGKAYLKDVETTGKADKIKALFPETVRKRLRYYQARDKIVFTNVLSKDQMAGIIEILRHYDELLDQWDSTRMIGAYGWLEKPSAKGVKEKTGGYFQAPSLDQAAAGAILRNAVLSKEDVNSTPFQVNLSSERVKKAVWFIEGLNSGFAPTELLGYQVERKIHDVGLDGYLLALRKATSGSSTAEKAPSLINGENFIKESYKPQIYAAITDPKDLDQLDRIIWEVSQIGDAVSDLYTAEALYQTVRGNTARTAAWLEAMEGKNISPAPESVNSIRSGEPQLQRVVYAIEGAINFNEYTSPRVLAEPLLSAFIGSRFKDFGKQWIPVTVCSKEKPGQIIEYKFILQEFDVCPEDLIAGGKDELFDSIRVRLLEMVIDGRIDDGVLNRETLNPCCLDMLDNLFQVEVGYDVEVDGQLPLQKLFDTAEELKLFFSEIRPLKFEDMYDPSKTGLEDEEYMKRLLSARKSGYDILMERLQVIRKSMEEDRERLLKYSVDVPCSGVDETIRILAKFRKYGIKEALIPVPSVANGDEDKLFLESVGILGQKLEEQLALLSHEIEGLRYINADNGASKTVIDMLRDWEVMDDIAERYTIINRQMGKITSALLKWSAGKGLTIIAPFRMDEMLVIDKDRHMEWDLDPAFGEYRYVRKGLDRMLRLISDDVRVYSRFGAQKSREEILNQVLASAVALKQEDVADFALLVDCLRKSASSTVPGLSYIWGLLDADTQKVILGCNLAPGLNMDEKYMVLDGLNIVLFRPDLEYKQFTDGVAVRKDVFKLMDVGIETLTRLKKRMLNRYIFEDSLAQLTGKPSVLGFITLGELQKLEIPEAGSMDIHYILKRGGLKIEKDELVTAFVADEFSVVIPSSSEPTAVAFYHDSPQAEAPQALLVAVPPKIDCYRKWESLDLAKIIADTIDLMRIRSVSSEAVIGGNLGYILPALLYGPKGYFPMKELPQIQGTTEDGYYYKPAQ